MDRAQTMAKWEPQQCVNREMNGGLAALFWAPDILRSLTPNYNDSTSPAMDRSGPGPSMSSQVQSE